MEPIKKFPGVLVGGHLRTDRQEIGPELLWDGWLAG